MSTPTGVLLLHGYGGHRNSNWFKWLRNKLQSREIPVFAPDLPESDKPILTDHLTAIEKFADKLGKNPIIVAHSLGAVTAMRFIDTHRIANTKLVLVAPVMPCVTSKPNDWVPPAEFFAYRDSSFDLHWLAENVAEVVVFLSHDDPYIHYKSTLSFCRGIFTHKLTLREYSSAGHFNTPAGYTEFPDLLPYLFSE